MLYYFLEIVVLLSILVISYIKLKEWIGKINEEVETIRKNNIAENKEFIEEVEDDIPDIIEAWKESAIDRKPEYKNFLAALHEWATDELYIYSLNMDLPDEVLEKLKDFEIDESFPKTMEIQNLGHVLRDSILDERAVRLYLNFMRSHSDSDRDKFVEYVNGLTDNSDWDWRD